MDNQKNQLPPLIGLSAPFKSQSSIEKPVFQDKKQIIKGMNAPKKGYEDELANHKSGELKGNPSDSLNSSSQLKPQGNIPILPINNLMNDPQNEEFQRKWDQMRADLEMKETALKKAQEEIKVLQMTHEKEKNELLINVQKELKESKVIIPKKIHDIPSLIQSLVITNTKNKPHNLQVPIENKVENKHPPIKAENKLEDSKSLGLQNKTKDLKPPQMDKTNEPVFKNGGPPTNVATSSNNPTQVFSDQKVGGINPNVQVKITPPSKEMDYETIKKEMISSKKLTDKAIKCINDEKYWNFYKEDIDKIQFINLFQLISLSKKIQKIDFGFNPSFDKECVNRLFESIKDNKSIQGLIFFQNNFDPDDRIKIIDLFMKIPSLSYIIFERDEDDEDDEYPPPSIKRKVDQMNIEMGNRKSKQLQGLFDYDDKNPWNYYSWKAIVVYTRKSK